MNRRAALSYITAGMGLLASACNSPPGLPLTTTPPPTPVPTEPPVSTAPPTQAPTVVPTAPTQAPAPAPTVPGTSEPTSQPTAQPTAQAVPALADAVDRAMQEALARNVLAGGVALVRYRGQQLLLEAYGLSKKYDSLKTLCADPTPATIDTMYDLASISKLFTTTCVMRLVEAGKLTLDDPVARWMPEFAAGGKDEVTLRQILTHTSGMPPGLPLWKINSTPDARLQRVMSTPLVHHPGTKYVYSDLGLIAMGHLVEVVTASPLDQVVHDQVTAPLQLGETMYTPPVQLKTRIAPTEDESGVDAGTPAAARGMVWGEVHDENAWALDGVAGHAGVFATAENLGRFAQLFVDGGAVDGTRLLQPETVAEMTRNQIPGIGWRGLGWELNQNYYMGHLASPATFGHTGFTGASLVIDPRRSLIVVLQTNHVHPTRNGPSMNATRMAIANAAMAAFDVG